MDPSSWLCSAIRAMVEGETNLESAMICLATCQRLCLESCNDVNGRAWSRQLLHSILISKLRDRQDEISLFAELVRCFSEEKHMEIRLESGVALAACHMAGVSQSEYVETRVKWLLQCLREAKTDYLKLQAAICLGNLHLKVSEEPEQALRCFQMAKEIGRRCNLPDSTAIASYYCGQALLALNQVAQGLAAVEQDGSKFNAALVCMLEAEAQARRSRFSPDKTIAAFTKARTMLVPLMPDLYVELNNYLGDVVCCRECLLSILSLDRFTEVFIENCSRFTVKDPAEEEGPEIVDRSFFIYQLYRASRLEMIQIQAQVVPFEPFMDPRPYLEHGIELVRSEDPSSALEPLIVCQQVALRTGHTSAFFWASGYIDVYCEKQGKKTRIDQETVFMQLADCFRKVSCDGEDVQAWAAYYAGRAGKELNRKADVEMLRLALEKSTTCSLGYYAALGVGDACTDTREAVYFYEISKRHAVSTGKEDLIISAFLLLFGHLVNTRLGTERHEEAEGVRQELLTLISAFRDPRLGQAVERYMEGLLLLDQRAFEMSVSLLESLPRFPPVELYHPYLANGQGDTWSADMNFSAQTTYSNAVRMVTVSEPTQRRPAQLQLLDSAGSELDGEDIRNCFFLNWILRIHTLYAEKKLGEAEAEAGDMLYALAELDETAGLNGMFGGLVRYYLASICLAYHRGRGDMESLEYTFDVVDEFMTEATNLSANMTTFGLAHGAMQAQQGRFIETAETLCRALNRTCFQLERKFGRYSAGRIKNLERCEHSFAVLQATFWLSGELERALIWEERKRTRDLVYILREEEVEEFDTDDAVAWNELGRICEMIGRETVVLVMTQTADYLFLFMLHSGEEVLSWKHYLPELQVPLGFPGPESFKENREEEFHVLSAHYDILIKPFAQVLEVIQPERIVFVPSKDLWYFPFNALLDKSRAEKQYLVERYITSSVSSLRLLKYCELRRRELETGELSTLTSLVVGNPTLDLKEAAKEAEFVADMLKEVGFQTVNCPAPEEATKEEVLRLLPMNDWIHFATHADADDEEFVEGVLFLAAGSDGEFGSLTPDELQRKLSGSLKASAVVLSACKSGVGSLFKGEGVVALPRSFHACRVPSVVMSLWGVPDASAPVLMKYFYTNLARGMDIAESLREAVVAMIHEEDQWEEPAYDLKSWAPFVVSGSPFTKLVNVETHT